MKDGRYPSRVNFSERSYEKKYGNWFLQLPENQSLDVTVTTQISGSASDWLKQIPTRHEQSEALTRWNLCARLSDVFSRTNKWWSRKMFFDWENTVLDLHDSSDQAQPYPIIANHCFFTVR